MDQTPKKHVIEYERALDYRTTCTRTVEQNKTGTYISTEIWCYDEILMLTPLGGHAKEQWVYVGCYDGSLRIEVGIAGTHRKVLGWSISVSVALIE